MESSGAVMIEGEDYEVVDECTGEEDSSNSVQNKPASEDADTTKDTQSDSLAQDSLTVAAESAENNQKDETSVSENEPKNTEAIENSNNSIKFSIPKPINQCPRQSSMDIDFTADISLDQLDNEKDMTDEEVLHHLDEIENIVLDPTAFQLHDTTNENSQSNMNIGISIKQERIEEDETNESVTSNQEVSCTNNVPVKQEKETDGKNDWYEKKLAEKEATIKERLSKLARVLEFSYPCYEKWLQYAEKANGTPVCKLEPARRCRLDKPYTNRWKFICSRKPVEESTKETGDADASLNKNVETVWRLEATGSWGVNTNNESEFPPFVLRAVKIFEDFLQTTEQPSTQEAAPAPINFSDDVSIEMDTKKETPNEMKQQWLWLLVRCNSMDELMLFATGRNITRSTMDRLKQVYESGAGKDCNVKSLYCKSVNKCDDTTVINTTFLVGSEALDENVGGIKIQLAPKTNFWSNAAGAENIANAVADLLSPTPKTTILEIGCSIGLIGLMMASKCQQVIGVDSPSEVEEAEITCELNNIKNAKFIMGTASEVTSKITAAVKNRKTYAVINANTNIGRAIEVMTSLRKITSLKRIAMVTTLTKQSVRAILELARPVDRNHGHPFIPIQACVVDTLPVGPHFEAVILMERRLVHRFNQLWYLKELYEETKSPDSNTEQEKVDKECFDKTEKGAQVKDTESQAKKNTGKPATKAPGTKKGKGTMKKLNPVRNAEGLPVKGKFKGKRPLLSEGNEAPPKKVPKKFEKFGVKPWRAGKKKKEWPGENSQLRINPLYEKKMREHKEQADLRERLSSNRIDTDIVQKVKEHQEILEIAKEKLSGPAPTVDVTTAKQLQNMLNMVLEQTNKLQNQLPRSVWDRIAPPENANHPPPKDLSNDTLLSGRYIQEMGSEAILITTPNKKFGNEEDSRPPFKKFGNLPPVEPNLVMPAGYVSDNPFPRSSERYHGTDVRKQQIPGNSWNRDKTYDKNCWDEPGDMRRQDSPMKHRTSPLRFSPKRPLLSPPRRPYSPPRRHFSPLRRPVSPVRQRSPMRRQMSPQGHPISPSRRQASPLRRAISPRRRPVSPLTRPISPMNGPPRRPMSPQRREFLLRTPASPPRRQLSPTGRQISPIRRQIPSPNRMMFSIRRDILPPKRPQDRDHVSPIRRGGSPQRFSLARPTSPSRRQLSPSRRQMSPPRRFNDEWDMPNRSNVEHNTWARPIDRMSENNWQNVKRPSTNTNWEQTSGNDTYRRTVNQEKWDNKSSRENTWSDSGNDWNNKQPTGKNVMKESWSQSSESRWPSTSNVGGSNDNWNNRTKDNFANREEPWMCNNKQNRWETSNAKQPWNQGDKEDWNDLPEDARDPWGDDGNLGLKERWHKFDNMPSSSSAWARDNEQGDSWPNSKDNWQSKGQSLSTKSPWQNSGSQHTGESRWTAHNDPEKKNVSSTWKTGNNVGSWQPQKFSFHSQRSFSTNQFKDQR